MRRQSSSRSFFFRICPAIPAVLVAPLLAAAPPIPPNEPPSTRFIDIQAEHLAVLCVSSPCAPEIGPWSALSAVYAGASIDAPVWNLRGVLSTRAGRTNVGAGTLFLSGFGPRAATPLMELAVLQAGEHRDCWDLIDTDKLRPFPKYFLTPGFIRDRRGIFNGDPEVEAYWQVLVQAHYTSAKAFAKAARRDLTYAHLFNEPERHRGEVVHVSGRLIRLQRWTAPNEARAAGVANLYEGWIMTDAYGENPVGIAFTDLPSGLTVDNERKYNEKVGFDGYFYKRYRYKASDSKKVNEFRDAPLLIGHTLTGRFVSNRESGDAENWGHGLIWVFVCVVGGALLGVIVLTCWFRYHDRRIRQRIYASRNREFVPPPEEIV